MNKRIWKLVFALICFTMIWTIVPVGAQSSCPHAEIRLETQQEVDVEAVCEAARPWAEDGFQVFIFLTDTRPASEDAWFALLDEAEVAAGLRDAGQRDLFERNGLAFEATTATDVPWGYVVTYGEALYGSALDDEGVLTNVQEKMREEIAAGNPTTALVQALTVAYDIYRPTPRIPWALIIALGIFGLLALGVLLVVAIIVILPRITRQPEETALQRELEELRARTSNLLNACYQLLEGEHPEDTVLYQLFRAYGGEQQASLRQQVGEWLRRCQEALDDAFALRKTLTSSQAQATRSLEQQVHDWEMLYVTFVGNSERIHNLTENELHTLLDPVLVLDRQSTDVRLARQLDEIRREFSGRPLKVKLQHVDVSKVDAEGILGYIDLVKTKIAYLQTTRAEAPEKLDEVRVHRDKIVAAIPEDFTPPASILVQGIDAMLAEAEDELAQGEHLRALDRLSKVMQALATVDTFVSTVQEHTERHAELEALLKQGYRPRRFEQDMQEISEILNAIEQEVQKGNYVEMAELVETFAAESQDTLAHAQSWQALHTENTAAVQALRENLTRLEQLRTDEVSVAWNALQAYKPEFFPEIAKGMASAVAIIQRLREEALPEIVQANSMEIQAFPKAEKQLAQAAVDLGQAETRLQAVVNHLAEMQAAEANIEEALRLTDADISKAEAFRDAEDIKIGPEVDQKLEEAREHLEEARHLAEAGDYVAAVEVQTTARQIATAAFADASEQVQRINTLQESLEKAVRRVAGKVGQCSVQAGALPASSPPLGGSQRGERIYTLIQQAGDSLSKAKQARAEAAGLEDKALAKALQAALDAYEVAQEQADRALDSIHEARQDYESTVAKTRQAVDKARDAIDKAERVMADPDAGRAGEQALQRARDTLPQRHTLEGETKSALQRIYRQAEEARRYAETAERYAQQRIRQAEEARKRRQLEAAATQAMASVVGGAFSTIQQRPVGTSQISSSTSSKEKDSITSSIRPGKGMQPERKAPKAKSTSSGHTSSSRRSTGGSARRSSSGGSSRRHSSGGSSRRRGSDDSTP